MVDTTYIILNQQDLVETDHLNVFLKLALITISSSVIPIGMGKTNTKVLQNVYFNEP